MENNEQIQNENVVLEEKQESKLTFWKIVLIYFLIIISLVWSFLAWCWWMVYIRDTYNMLYNTFIIVFIALFISILFFMRSKLNLWFKNTVLILLIDFILLYITYLIYMNFNS